jgi:hypothetical protein
MRAFIVACVDGLALAASAQAAPLAPNPASIEFGAASLVELVRDGCGRGWHRSRWRDHGATGSGVTAFQNEGGYGLGYGYDGRGAGLYVPLPDLRGVLPRWG